MSADLHIIIFDPKVIAPEQVKEYATFSLDNVTDENFQQLLNRQSELSDLIYHEDETKFLDDVWVGQVSWLKAGLTDSATDYVPAVVAHVSDTYWDNDGAAVITEELITELLKGFALPSASIYEQTNEPGSFDGISDEATVKAFLEANIGKWSFVDSW